MSWFEEWFDSPLYEKLYANRNEEEAAQLADLLEKELPQQNFPRILDLGCGRGRHSITLAERGYQVTGIDLSEEAIKQARIRAVEKQLNNVTFLVGDMREPLTDSFDAVLNLFTTFGYFLDDDENRKVLQSTHEMLNPDGLFVIDFLNAEKVKKEIVSEDRGAFKEINFHIKRFIKDRMVYKEIRFTGPSLEEPVQYQERVKLYGLNWFEENLNNFGFSLDKVYGSYTGLSFDKNESPRLIIISRKKDDRH
jgi:SAM-dependent methyltransferase